MASRISLIFTSFFLTLTVLLFPRWEKQFTEAPIAWDVSGYYSYLPALFIYHDIKKLNWLPDIVEKYKPSHNIDQAFPAENGNMVFKYPAGMSILYSPLFFAAHSYALASDFPADGFSLPYQIAIQLGGLIAAIIGLIFLQKILIRYFSDYTTAWVVLLIGLGSNFFNYATFDSGNVHVWSFALLSILTYLTILFHEKQKWKYAIGIGTCIGLSALVRPTEILFFLIPLLWAIGDKKSISGKIVLIKNHFPRILAAILIVASIGFIQLIYWKIVSGNWFVYSYENQGFSLSSPHFPNVFLSYRKGWFIYTPLMLFALIGFIFFIKKWKEKSSPYVLPALLFFIVNTWTIASWNIWWYGGAFGQRALIPSYVLLAFPLSLFINWINNSRWKKILFIPIFTGCIALNLFQTYQAHWGPWEAIAMNKTYYWKIFLNTENNPIDKILLDTNIEFNGNKKKNNTLIYTPELFNPLDTIGLSKSFSHTGNYVLTIEPGKEYSHILKIDKHQYMNADKWINITALYATKTTAPNYWYMPQAMMRFMNNDEVIKTYSFRPQRAINKTYEWLPIEVNFPIPKATFNQVEFLLVSPQKTGSLLADIIEVSVFEE